MIVTLPAPLRQVIWISLGEDDDRKSYYNKFIKFTDGVKSFDETDENKDNIVLENEETENYYMIMITNNYTAGNLNL